MTPDNLGELLPVVPPRISPDCVVEKCRACSGDAWDDERDAPARCDHECHGDAS